jgi:hypothetical protein
MLAVTLFLLLVVGCRGTGGGGSGSSQEEETTSSAAASEGTSAATQETTATASNAAATVILAPMNGSDTTGAATFTDTADGVEIKLNVLDLPDPNATYLTHIHPGTCADEQGGGKEEQQGTAQEHEHTGYEGTNEEIEYPLPPITADPRGRGSTTAVLTGLTVQGLFSGGPRYINVHAEGSGNPPALACGQLGGTG